MWVMSSLVERDPFWRLTVYIGDLQIASLHFDRRQCVLTSYGEQTWHASAKDALIALHSRLKAPSPEGAKVPDFKKEQT